MLAGIPRSAIGLPFPEEEDAARSPWTLPPSRDSRRDRLSGAVLPRTLAIVLSDQAYVPKEGLPPRLRNELVRLTAFQNPEFYRAQAMRLPTFGRPRVITCAEDYPSHIALPRGVHGKLHAMADELGVEIEVDDQRCSGSPIETVFKGKLTSKQTETVEALLAEDNGVLSATTGFGKNVLAAAIIARRGVNTLILVHRRHLLDQWLARLDAFLDTTNVSVGHLGSGKRRLSGQIDVALIQTLVRKDVVDDCVADYGQLIVDECHHISAVSFEKVTRHSKARYVLGLTATPFRKDGQNPIVFMQCGPIRFRVEAKQEAAKRPFDHAYYARETAFHLPLGDDVPAIQAIYRQLAQDGARHELMFDDVLKALAPTRRTEDQSTPFCARRERLRAEQGAIRNHCEALPGEGVGAHEDDVPVRQDLSRLKCECSGSLGDGNTRDDPKSISRSSSRMVRTCSGSGTR